MAPPPHHHHHHHHRPEIHGAELGWVSDDMVLLESWPDAVVVGAGFIACEFAGILNGLGVKLTRLVRADHLLRGFDLVVTPRSGESMDCSGGLRATGRRPFCKGLNLAAAAVASEGHRIPVDVDQTTNVPIAFAVGT